MKKALLLVAAAGTLVLALTACQGGPTDPQAYKRSHDRYMDSYEPKTGGP
ncbi:MAG: hypothetical protein J2P50_14715 [Hyphomicrobiaceae bacterium]|nr:hypothetical protein [Hyphomicrobiaceae bacterium]